VKEALYTQGVDWTDRRCHCTQHYSDDV